MPLLVALAASVAAIVTADVPAVVGVPDTVPVAVFSVSPAGKAPEATDQVKEPLPPLAASVAL